MTRIDDIYILECHFLTTSCKESQGGSGVVTSCKNCTQNLQNIINSNFYFSLLLPAERFSNYIKCQ